MILDGYIIEERMIIIFSQAGWLYLSPKSVFIAYFTSSEWEQKYLQILIHKY